MLHDPVDVARWKATFPLARLREQHQEQAQASLDHGEWAAREAERAAFDPVAGPLLRAVSRLLLPPELSFDNFVGMVREMTNQSYATVSQYVPSVSRITGPYDIAVVEQHREQAGGRLARARRVPADLFVFGRGEPARRDLTKIGGLPYLPRDRAWPRNERDEPLTFVAQFCFSDSQDIAGNLPGDLLLIFGQQWETFEEDSPDLQFEWVRLGETDLVATGDLPRTEWDILPCFGAIHRTDDFVFDDPDEEDRVWPAMAQLNGTKIGGVPVWHQDPEPQPGRYLCTLGSIHPRNGEPYPYINVEPPLGGRGERNTLIWGDVGSVYLFIEDSGRVHWTMQC